MTWSRVAVVVLDGLGCGELPDAAAYGDVGSSTLANMAHAVGGLCVPCLGSLGLGCILPIDGVPPAAPPRGDYGRMSEKSPGKDSISGHWELMGVSPVPAMPTYPHGFPQEVLDLLAPLVPDGFLANEVASGTEIIQRLGECHLRTGKPILYTSADSVLQIAAHEDVLPLAELHTLCAAARAVLTGHHAVGRVIARPFAGSPGSFARTRGRRDYPLSPPPNLLDALATAEVRVGAVGKIAEYFSGRGITTSDPVEGTLGQMAALRRMVVDPTLGFVFANIEDFDMLYGHRNDVPGFAAHLAEFDAMLGDLLPVVAPDLLLLLVSDHGNDPTTPSTDHSREHALLLAYPGTGRSLGVRATFADVATTVAEALGVPWDQGVSRSFRAPCP
jgi:phosphopentomutase